MKYPSTLRHVMAAACAGGIAALLASCGSAPKAPVAVTPPPAPQALPAPPTAAVPDVSLRSEATNPRAYRRDAAAHIYKMNSQRIWKGHMHPLLYAIGVLQVDVDGRGNVRGLHWMRAPNHAPEVVREIERTVRAAAPFPAPVRMGKVVYTDTWLWDKSGRFQLDTLTEGQDDR
jgi:periplasmic protein TonB